MRPFLSHGCGNGVDVLDTKPEGSENKKGPAREQQRHTHRYTYARQQRPVRFLARGVPGLSRSANWPSTNATVCDPPEAITPLALFFLGEKLPSRTEECPKTVYFFAFFRKKMVNGCCIFLKKTIFSSANLKKKTRPWRVANSPSSNGLLPLQLHRNQYCCDLMTSFSWFSLVAFCIILSLCISATDYHTRGRGESAKKMCKCENSKVHGCSTFTKVQKNE